MSDIQRAYGSGISSMTPSAILAVRHVNQWLYERHRWENFGPIGGFFPHTLMAGHITL